MDEVTVHIIPDFVRFDFQTNLVVTVLNFWRVWFVNRVDAVSDRHNLCVITKIETVINDPSVAEVTFSPRPQPGITRDVEFSHQRILEVQVTGVGATKVCNLSVMSDPPHWHGASSPIPTATAIATAPQQGRGDWGRVGQTMKEFAILTENAPPAQALGMVIFNEPLAAGLVVQLRCDAGGTPRGVLFNPVL